MMRKTERRAFDARKNIQIRCFGGKCKRERGERRLAIQPGAPQARPGQEVSDRFQARMSILHAQPSIARSALLPLSIPASPVVNRLTTGDTEDHRVRIACRSHLAGVNSVKASGTTVISAGSLPINSPSAST